MVIVQMRIIGGILPTLLTIALAGCGSDSTVNPAPTPTTPIPTTPTPVPSPRADIIFSNGQVITLEPDLPTAEALAVLGKDILLVGSNEEVLTLVGPEPQRVDLGGRALLPGFVDAHTHPINIDSPESFEETQQYVLEGGTTSLGNNGNPDKLPVYLEAQASGGLRIRISLYLAYNSKCNGVQQPEDWILDHPPILDPTAMLRIPGVKVFADSAGPNNTCGWSAMSVLLPTSFAEEKNTGPYGADLFNVEELAQVIAKHQAFGYQVEIHARGDVTVETSLDAIESALAGGPNTFRHRIDHNDFVRPELLSRFGEIGALPVVRGRPFACILNNNGGAHVFGEEVHPWFYPVRSLLDANPGLPVAWHSDVTPYGRRPIRDLYDFVTRKGIRGSDGSGCTPPDWYAAQAVSVEDALRLMTINGAYALSMEDEVGSLKVGKFADLIILSDSPLLVAPDDLINLEVLMTMVGGKVEHCLAGYEAICPD